MTALAVGQPELPEMPDGWPEATRTWWDQLAELPTASELTANEWSYLLDTALLPRAMWGAGELRHATEIRLRLAKFGLTLEDRARLHLEHVAPSEPTTAATAASLSLDSRTRHAGLRVTGSTPEADSG